MSVIAWDGRELAADRQATRGGNLIRSVQKIHQVNGLLVAYAGTAGIGEELLAWFQCGADPDLFPGHLRGDGNDSSLAVFYPDGSIAEYDRSASPVRFEKQLFVMGCGRDFAIAAMHCGKTAAEAVEVAIHFDAWCGQGVDVMAYGPDGQIIHRRLAL